MKSQTQNEATGGAQTHDQPSISAKELRKLLLDAGADDAACVSIDAEGLGEERDFAKRAMPSTRTLVSFCMRMNREPIRSTERSLANAEFHATGEDINEIGRKVVRALERRGLRAMNPPMGFPMEAHKFPARMWVLSHKPIAVAAGLGVMGIHRNVIHPKFGNFILLGTLLVETELDQSAKPLDFNPCMECKLCVAACPVGAIGSDGNFDFSACYTHNYREFMGGFTDWVGQIADSKSAHDYSERVTDGESVSMWQSLSFGANYKAAYCLSACPAGEDVIAPFMENRGQFVKTVVKPLQQKEETIYVVSGSDAEAHVEKRYPHKTVRHVNSGLRPIDVESFVRGMPLVFQRGRVKQADSCLHFTFSGDDQRKLTIVIRAGELHLDEGHVGKPNLRVRADAKSWIKFLRGEISLPRVLLTGKLSLRGNPKHLLVMDRAFV